MGTRHTDHFGAFAQALTDADELETLAALRARLSLVPQLLARWDKVAAVAVKGRSEIALDDEATSWRNLSHGLHFVLNHAADCLRTLHHLLPPEGDFQMPMVSHFPVVRSAMEAGSLALWILGPDDPRERISRHLRNAWREVGEESSMFDAINDTILEGTDSEFTAADADKSRKQTRAWKKKHTIQIRDCAQSLAIPDPTMARWSVGFAEIVRDATAHAGLDALYGEIVWRNLSGLSHPSTMRALRVMAAETVHEHGDGTQGIRLTSDVRTVQYSFDAAFLQFVSAVELFAKRKVRPADPNQYVRR